MNEAEHVIHESDDLRTLDTISKPDARRAGGQGIFERRLEWHHAEVSKLRLHASVPRDIRIHFLTACNALLYSWYVYRFIHVAELHALATLEWALRHRLAQDGLRQRYLGPLLEEAVRRRLLLDEGLRLHQRRLKERREAMADERAWPEDFRQLFGHRWEESAVIDPQAFVKRLPMSLPKLRNELAHGSFFLYSQGCLRVELCCDLINQLYPNPDG